MLRCRPPLGSKSVSSSARPRCSVLRQAFWRISGGTVHVNGKDSRTLYAGRVVAAQLADETYKERERSGARCEVTKEV